MISTVVGGISMLMFSYASMYGVVKGFDHMLGKQLPIQSITMQEWSDKE